MRKAGMTMAEIMVAFCILSLAILPIFTLLSSTTDQLKRNVNTAQAQGLINEIFQQLVNLDKCPGYELIATSNNKTLPELFDKLNEQLSNKELTSQKMMYFSDKKQYGIVVSPLPEMYETRRISIKQVDTPDIANQDAKKIKKQWYMLTIRLEWRTPGSEDALSHESYLFISLRA